MKSNVWSGFGGYCIKVILCRMNHTPDCIKGSQALINSFYKIEIRIEFRVSCAIVSVWYVECDGAIFNLEGNYMFQWLHNKNT